MTPLAAGHDLAADLDAEIVLEPLDRAKVPTGIAIALPVGYEAQVRPRSGLAAREGVTILNAPGTIDADFRGEIHVILVNLDKGPVTIRPGERIAQLVVAPVMRVEWEESADLDATDRGPGGFGHTGR